MQKIFAAVSLLDRYRRIPFTASNGAKSPPIMSIPIFIAAG
jgi:hypothetical protein